MIAVHLAAPNDANGNSRRVYVVFDDEADVIAVVDEGYRGTGALKDAGFEGIHVSGKFATTPGEYRNLIKVGRDLAERARREAEGISEYEVVVGNIGTVYRGPDESMALKKFEIYVAQSEEGYGRASGESVTILKDGDVWREHMGAERTGD